METRTYKVYKFDEITSDELKARIVANLRDINVDYEQWSDGVKDEWKERIERNGYWGVEIMFTGFSSQGDGACFTAYIDIDKWLKAHRMAKKFALLMKYSEFVHLAIAHYERDYYSTSTNVRYELVDSDEMRTGTVYDRVETQVADVHALVLQEREKFGDAIYRALKREYEERTSDDAIIRTIRSNDYDFTEAGDID